VVAGDEGLLYMSSDGITWTDEINWAGGISRGGSYLAYANGTFIWRGC
jgi:hypothetical protein